MERRRYEGGLWMGFTEEAAAGDREKGVKHHQGTGQTRDMDRSGNGMQRSRAEQQETGRQHKSLPHVNSPMTNS